MLSSVCWKTMLLNLVNFRKSVPVPVLVPVSVRVIENSTMGSRCL